MKKEIIGIDVSKLTIDVWLHLARAHKCFKNGPSGFLSMLKWVQKLSKSELSDLSFCFEHTGLYSYALRQFLHDKNVCYFIVSGLMVKRTLGLTRGKSDRVDASNLARFAFLHKEELKPYVMPSKDILRLKELLSFRNKLVRQCAGHKTFIKERRQILKVDDQDAQILVTHSIIELLKDKIKLIENELISIYKKSEQLNQTFQKIVSIKGVGLIVATAVITATNNFTSFNTWRQFACYAGIAPFEHKSGSSIRGKTRISQLGNRYLKTILSQSAATAIQFNAELKTYYKRRIEQGKNKMSTLNIIRNKIVSRIFAVARRNSPYVNIYKFAA